MNILNNRLYKMKEKSWIRNFARTNKRWMQQLETETGNFYIGVKKKKNTGGTKQSIAYV